MTFDHLTATPAEFIAEIHASRAEWEALIAPMSESDLELAGMTGHWNGRQTIIHLARWTETTTAMILRYRHGLLPGVDEYEDYDQWNDWWMEIDGDMPLSIARDRERLAFDGLIRTLLSFPDDAWDAYVRGWVHVAANEHYQKHVETTRAWLALE